MALAMVGAARQIAQQFDVELALRIGIASGPLMAGVIGAKRLTYDVWGDTVNLASRALTPPPEMEQTIGARGASAIRFRPQHFPPRVKNVMTMSGNHDMVSTLKELETCRRQR
jgi:hypothetical protein